MLSSASIWYVQCIREYRECFLSMGFLCWVWYVFTLSKLDLMLIHHLAIYNKRTSVYKAQSCRFIQPSMTNVHRYIQLSVVASSSNQWHTYISIYSSELSLHLAINDKRTSVYIAQCCRFIQQSMAYVHKYIQLRVVASSSNQ